MDQQILMDNNIPVILKMMPKQIEAILNVLGNAPYSVARPIIESIIQQCSEQAVKPSEPDEPAKP